ncbi:uncharacterized protein LOC117646343 [Thrips palmi]|uniref:Uncharacterized protein LOC117646343 n=1 Tax=Thrips palmi TaxID=161013 RepID=A0A6P8YSV3_THRPL|nr:uncharacterized protein LOC117646343 [Thrips palmi]
MEPPQGQTLQGVAAAPPLPPPPSAPLQTQPPQHAPRPTPGDNNSSCQDDVLSPSDENSHDVRTATTPDFPDVQYRTFSEVVRASPVLAARQPEAHEVGALSPAAADEGDEDDEDDAGQTALWQPPRGDQSDAEVEVIQAEPPLGAPPSLRQEALHDVRDDALGFGGYVAHGLDQDDQDLPSLLDDQGSSTSLESAASELPEDADDREHFFSPLKRIVRSYLRRRTVAPERMGNLQGSEGKAGRAGAGGKSPGKLRKAAARKSPFSDPFLTPQSADGASHYSDADGAEGDVIRHADDEDDDDDPLSDARTLTPASARHSSRLQDKTSDDDATLTDCDDRSDWERTPQPTPQHAPRAYKASLQDLCAVESVGLSRDDLTYSMAGSMTGSMAGSVSSVSGLSGSVGSVSGNVSSLGGGGSVSGVSGLSGAMSVAGSSRDAALDLS